MWQTEAATLTVQVCMGSEGDSSNQAMEIYQGELNVKTKCPRQTLLQTGKVPWGGTSACILWYLPRSCVQSCTQQDQRRSSLGSDC